MTDTAGSAPTRFLKHSSIYALGSILRNIVGFIMLPVYTRYLSPADYGVISLMLFMLSLMELLFSARLGYALPKMYAEADSSERKKKLISTGLIFMFAVGLFSSLAVYAARTQIAGVVFGTTGYAIIVGYFAFLVLTQSVETHGLDYIRLQQRPGLFLAVSICKMVLQLSLNIWLVVVENRGVIGVALSTMWSSIVMALALLLYMVVKAGIKYDKKLALRMLAFSWPMWFAGLAGLYIGSSNRYYLRLFSSMDSVGLYALAERFASIMGMLIWQPFSQYWMVESFNYYQRGEKKVFGIVFRVISAVLFIAGLGISLFAAPTIYLMSSKEFYAASNAVPFLVQGSIFSCLANFLSLSFMVTENTKRLSLYNYVTAVAVSVLYLLLIPLLGHTGAAIALAAAQGMQLLITYYYGRKYYDMNISLRTLLYLLAAFAAAYLLGMFVPARSGIVVQIAVKFVVYVGAVAAILYWLLRDTDIRAYVLARIPAPLRFRILRILPHHENEA